MVLRSPNLFLLLGVELSLTSSARDRAIENLEERELFTLLRRRAGVTQRDVAAEAGIRQPLVSVWEKGSTEISRERVDALWTALETLSETEVVRGAA
jgi:predicted transcriptional regulator